MIESPCLSHQGGPATLEPKKMSQLSLYTGEVKCLHIHREIHKQHTLLFISIFYFYFYIISWNISFYFKNGTLSAYAKLFFGIMFQEMITQLRGCSLALQYTCPGQPQLSHHLSKPQDLWQDKERRHQNTLALSPSCSLLRNYPPLLFPALFPEQ